MILIDAIGACACAFAIGTWVWIKPESKAQWGVKIGFIVWMSALMILDIVLLAKEATK